MHRLQGTTPLEPNHRLSAHKGRGWYLGNTTAAIAAAANSTVLSAEPAAYGDFLAGILAIPAEIWGAADLLFALYEGPHAFRDPGMLEAAFHIPTAIVPRLAWRFQRKNRMLRSRNFLYLECMHRTIEPTILYFGTPVALISTINPDGSANLAPMSSAWWLGWTCMLGLGHLGQTSDNLIRTKECVINRNSSRGLRPLR